MDFYEILMEDEDAIHYLMKRPEITKFVFQVEDECPRTFLIRESNSFVSNEPSRHGRHGNNNK